MSGEESDVQKIVDDAKQFTLQLAKSLSNFDNELFELSRDNSSRRFKAKLEMYEKYKLYRGVAETLYGSKYNPLNKTKIAGKNAGKLTSLVKKGDNVSLALSKSKLQKNIKSASIIKSFNAKMMKNATKNFAKGVKGVIKGVKLATTANLSAAKTALYANPIGWAFAALDGISIIVDLLDPCSLSDALFQQDLDEQIQALNALYDQEMMFIFMKNETPAVPPFVYEVKDVSFDDEAISKYMNEFYKKNNYDPNIIDINIYDEILQSIQTVNNISKKILLEYKNQLSEHNKNLDVLDKYLIKNGEYAIPVKNENFLESVWNNYPYVVVIIVLFVIGLLLYIVL